MRSGFEVKQLRRQSDFDPNPGLGGRQLTLVQRKIGRKRGGTAHCIGGVFMADDMEKNRQQGGQQGQQGGQSGQQGGHGQGQQGGQQSGQSGQTQKKGGQGQNQEEDDRQRRSA
jgi:hypothetical protein